MLSPLGIWEDYRKNFHGGTGQSSPIQLHDPMRSSPCGLNLMFRRRMGREFKQGYGRDQFPNVTLESRMGASGAPQTPSPPSVEHRPSNTITAILQTQSQPSLQHHHGHLIDLHKFNISISYIYKHSSSQLPVAHRVGRSCGQGIEHTHPRPMGTRGRIPFPVGLPNAIREQHPLPDLDFSEQTTYSQHSTGLLNNHHWH